MSNKKFFSGNSVRQALLAAASHFDLPADEIAYREVEKKHGFLKVRKRAVIEVDVDDPRRPPAAASSAASGTASPGKTDDRPTSPSRRQAPRAPQPPDEDESAAAAADTAPETRTAASEDEGDRDGDGEVRPPGRRRRSVRTPPRVEDTPKSDPDDDEPDEPEEPSAPASRRPAEAEQDDADDDEDADGSADDQGDDDRDRARPNEGETDTDDSASGGARRRRRRRGGRGRRGAATTPSEGSSEEGLVPLPERPRRPAERYAEARGPLADATREALDRVLDVAGLDLSYTVLQGEDRVEVDLTGADEALLVAEGGELLRAIEHLVPRVVRGLTGEPLSVRVDSADFHEIHEEQLRSLAQRVASEVRRSERPRTLEPMSPADRRIVHITLADEPRVTSMSEGSGYFKRLTVKPT